MDDPSQVTHVDPSPWSRPVEPLRCQGEPTRLARGQGPGHEHQTLKVWTQRAARTNAATDLGTLSCSGRVSRQRSTCSAVRSGAIISGFLSALAIFRIRFAMVACVEIG